MSIQTKVPISFPREIFLHNIKQSCHSGEKQYLKASSFLSFIEYGIIIYSIATDIELLVAVVEKILETVKIHEAVNIAS